MAGTRRRLDRELVRRGLAASGEEAKRLIAAGRVTVSGMVADKPARMVLDADPVVVRAPAGEEYASRGGHKLAGALRDFSESGLAPATGRVCLDAGASTGGFTDVLLRAGAEQVIAVDVGYGQLVWRLQSDERVVVIDRTNVRYLTPADIPVVPSLVVADLSFISLALVLPALTAIVATDGDLVVMVKPQFEVGRAGIGKGGVVTDPDQRTAAVWHISQVAEELGWGARAIAPSQLPGPAGNREYFLWLRAGPSAITRDEVATFCDKATTL